MVHSLNKGKNFERKIAKILSDTFNIKFFRVPQSGATSTTKNLNSPIFKGDIFTEDEKFYEILDAVIECKKKAKITLLDFCNYLNNKGFINEWIHQCAIESGGMNFWLIFSSNNSTTFVIEGQHACDKGIHELSKIKTLEQFLKEKKELYDI